MENDNRDEHEADKNILYELSVLEEWTQEPELLVGRLTGIVSFLYFSVAIRIS